MVFPCNVFFFYSMLFFYVNLNWISMKLIRIIIKTTSIRLYTFFYFKIFTWLVCHILLWDKFNTIYSMWLCFYLFFSLFFFCEIIFFPFLLSCGCIYISHIACVKVLPDFLERILNVFYLFFFIFFFASYNSREQLMHVQ